MARPFVGECPSISAVLRFHIPLIKPDVRFSRIRLSNTSSRARPREVVPLPFEPNEVQLRGCVSATRRSHGRKGRDTGAYLQALDAGRCGRGTTRLMLQLLPSGIMNRAIWLRRAMSQTAQIVEVLGGPAVVGRRVRSRQQLAEKLRAGLPYSAFESLLKRLDVRRVELAAILHLPGRTLARRKREGILAPVESNQVFRLARLVTHAAEVFGDPQKAAEWLRRRNHALGGRTPLSLLDTDIGVQEVDDILGRIEHGIFS